MDNDQIRESLTGEESRLSALRDDLRAADELDVDQQTESGGEISTVDQHPADVATENQQREMDLSLIERIEDELKDVERALAKLNDGSYGKCEACGKGIDPARLQELPATRFCLADAMADQTTTDISTHTSVDTGSNSQAPI